ncbi:sensor histidine kinase [Paenibacillus spongiae]|uniref:Histidine kinase n=1 Tax=Paenibacillus spongiae TaxID=2909671 RepID=A0ABY5S7F2_9BACL|nr:histidine kinase [Paenibacillus spongiae]UVI28470.1 histidine kinase [Paenibacillus spongiae]
MTTFLRIIIYRNKFWAYLIFIVLIGFTLHVLTSAIVINQSLGNARIEAANAFSRIENNFQNDTDRIEAYIQRIYSNQALMKDTQYFMSPTVGQYLTNRLLNNPYSEQELLSFPEDVKTYLYNWAQGDITQVSVHSEHNGNVILFDNKGIPSYQFGLSNEDEIFQESLQKGFVYRKKLFQRSEGSGEIRFLVSSERIFSSVSNYQLDKAAAVNASGDIFLIGNGNMKIVQRAIANKDSHGLIFDDSLAPIFYDTFSSSKFNYKFVSTIDLGTLIRQQSSVLFMLFFVILTAIVSVLLLVVYNLRDDARFLHRIIQSIKRVKTADFTPNKPARYRRNEYGMIAREVDDMIRQLDRHIHNEFVLKLKQQEAEMKALQHQINPHFLYNTLEVIRSTALVNQDAHTADAIATLGALYREIVQKDNIITIGSELELLQKYLKIMEFKYPDHFYYQIDVSESVMALPTIKFWMQTLAENFFVHGFSIEKEFNLFIVTGWEDLDFYKLEFIDNGITIEDDRLDDIRTTLSSNYGANTKSIGLYNVYNRLKYYYQEGLSISIDNNDEAGVKISVQISKEVIRDVQAPDR